MLIHLAPNPRTQAKAAIRRAQASARTLLRALDRDQQLELKDIYQRARDDLRAAVLAKAGADGSVHLETLQSLLAQVEQRLAALEAARNRLLDAGMTEAARIGAQTMAPAAAVLTASLVMAADEALLAVTSFVAEDGLQLSDRLWRIDRAARETIAREIQSAVIQRHSASRAAQDFMTRGQAVPPDLTAKAAAAGGERIARAAAQELMREGGSYEQALRVFRTEINRAHTLAFQAAAAAHPESAGTRFLLSPNHPKTDICDLHASVNRYGLGRGVYPHGKSPLPAHPNTLSFEEIVWSDEISAEDRAGAETRIEWLRAQTPAVQAGILGSGKAWALRRGYLDENAITTPWAALKSRLEKRGVVPPAAVRLEPVPAPRQPPPDVRPVSTALEAHDYAAVVSRALGAIDRLHSDGRLPVIPVVRSNSTKRLGGYHFRVNGPAVRISLSAGGAYKEMTLVHEIGHFLDHHGLPGDGFSSGRADALEGWRRAVLSSPEIRGIQDRLMEVRAARDVPRSRKVAYGNYLNYLLDPAEMWARSYAQWVAVRSGDPVLSQQLAAMVGRHSPRGGAVMTQWDGTTFEPIAREIDNLFRSLRWL